MTINRKISKKAAWEIADAFTSSDEFTAKGRELNLAEHKSSERLNDVITEIAEQMYAKQWFDQLSDDDKDNFGCWDGYTRHVTFNTEASYDGENRTTVLEARLTGWAWLSKDQLRVLRMAGLDDLADKLDLRGSLKRIMKDHPELIAWLRALDARNTYFKDVDTIRRRINSDICGRKVSDVLQAWPELTEAINAYYGQEVASDRPPLQAPLADVIASITTPLIKQGDAA